MCFEIFILSYTRVTLVDKMYCLPINWKLVIIGKETYNRHVDLITSVNMKQHSICWDTTLRNSIRVWSK